MTENITIYKAPVGYILRGNHGYKEVTLGSDNDEIIITHGEVMCPEDAKPGDLISKKSHDIYDPEIMSIIDIPRKRR